MTTPMDETVTAGMARKEPQAPLAGADAAADAPPGRSLARIFLENRLAALGLVLVLAMVIFCSWARWCTTPSR